MNDAEILAKAIKIASFEFRDVMDKGGNPYILHCLAVMYGVEHLGKRAMAAAVLHDLLEDTEWTVERLGKVGFPSDVVRAIQICTRGEEEEYLSYIGRVSCYPITKAIKLADLQHNMRPDRLIDLSEKSMERMKKYHAAYQFLLRSN